MARRFDYLADAPLAVGTRVRVRLAGRTVGGWVVESDVEPTEGVEPSPIAAVTGIGPPPPVVELAEWAGWRWAMPVATLLRVASPERRVRSLPEPPARRADPGGGAGSTGAPVRLRRLPPLEDPLPEVLSAIGEAGIVAGNPRERAAELSGDFSGGFSGGIPGGSTRAPRPGSVLVLVPSAGWAERLTARLRRRGFSVAGTWEEAAAGWPVVVGSRSTAWAPVPALLGAVVVDAHDEVYRRRYDAVEVVVERARRAGVGCRLLSPCPTVVQVGRYGVEVPDRLAERSGWSAINVVDRRSADPRTGILSEELVGLAGWASRLVCVLDRTGRERLLACASCGEVAGCERCGRPLERIGEQLHCRRCGTDRPVVCGACGATRLRAIRIGVSKVREELEALLGRPVGEVSGPKAEVPDTGVLVGTVAVLHRVRHAGAVVFLDFDQHLMAPRFTAAEEALALLARAARLVGRRGPVVVQTRIPDHQVLRAASAGDPGLLDEDRLRAELGLPPYSALASAAGEAAEAYFRPLGGVPIGDGRWLLRAPDHPDLCRMLAAHPRPAGRLRVEVDPTDL